MVRAPGLCSAMRIITGRHAFSEIRTARRGALRRPRQIRNWVLRSPQLAAVTSVTQPMFQGSHLSHSGFSVGNKGMCYKVCRV